MIKLFGKGDVKPLRVKRENLLLSLGTQTRKLPVLAFELTYGDISMDFSGRVKYEGPTLVSNEEGRYAKYHGEEPKWDDNEMDDGDESDMLGDENNSDEGGL